MLARVLNIIIKIIFTIFDETNKPFSLNELLIMDFAEGFSN